MDSGGTHALPPDASAEAMPTGHALKPSRPWLRLSVRGLMIAVVAAALAILAINSYWERNRRRFTANPVAPSWINTDHFNQQAPFSDQPYPIPITYDFRFSPIKHPPGTTCQIVGSVWIEDTATGLYVDGYTFDSTLTLGERESAKGSFRWSAQIPHPGRYLLHYRLHRRLPSGEYEPFPNSGGSSLDFTDPAIQNPAGATP